MTLRMANSSFEGVTLLAQKRAHSNNISRPLSRMNASSPVARQYSMTPYGMAAEMWCSCSAFKMRSTAPSGRSTDAGVRSSPVSVDSHAYSAPR